MNLRFGLSLRPKPPQRGKARLAALRAGLRLAGGSSFFDLLEAPL